MSPSPLVTWLEATVRMLAGPGALREITASEGTQGELQLALHLMSHQAASLVIGRDGRTIYAIRGLANLINRRLHPGRRVSVKVADVGGPRRPAGWRRVEEAGRV
jgi:predicted RNA-binding protein YlqC (UPF0109 family)